MSSDSDSAALLAALDEHAVVSVTDGDGRIVHANRKFCDLSGYELRELIGSDHRLLKSGEHDAGFYEDLWRCIGAGKTWRGELCNRHKSGERYWVQASITPELDDAGRPRRYVSIGTDITPATRARRRAELAEQRYARSQTYADIGTWDLDLRTHELYWSERIGPLFGYPLGACETSYERFLAAVHPDDRSALTQAVDRSIRDGAPYQVEHRCVWPDGTVRWLLERGGVTRGADGQPLRMLGVVQDITERKEAQAQLALFRQAVESTSEGVALCSLATRRLEYLNPAARAMLGCADDELLGVRMIELVPEAAQAEFAEAMERVKQGKTAQIDIDHARPDGRSIPLRNTLAPVLDEAGAVRFVVNIFGDRSHEIERQRALRTALDDARRANRAKAEFMSRMSHELRTPLNAVLGFSQILLISLHLNEAQEDGVREILKAGQHLLELVDEVLDIARIDLGMLRIALQPVPLREVAQVAMKLMAPIADDRRVSLVCEVDAGCVVLADRLRLKQCLINLLSNAVKYNRSPGTVRLRAAPSAPGRIRIEVEDTGHGIPDEEIPHLFKPFARLAERREGEEGVGIGLSITQKLVGLMNGRVGVRSRDGVGSVFWMDLERALPSGASREAAISFAGLGPLDDAARTSHKRVLYVEDNLANLKLVRSMLRLLPQLLVTTATSAAEGLQRAREERPDLILLDVGLPDMSGIELLGQLRLDPALAQVPVVAISANAIPADVQRGLDAGFDDYLTKPVDVHKLLLTVRALVWFEESKS